MTDAEAAQLTLAGLSERPRLMSWRMVVGLIAVVVGVAVLAVAGGSILGDSLGTLSHLHWPWIPVGIIAEAASMAAFARSQRRLLRSGGPTLQISCMMAVTYAGNAISVSLPVAGPEAATAFTYRQFARHGIDPATASWALAVSGFFSSVAFALVLAGGAVASANTTAAALGVSAAVLSVLPTIVVVGALRYGTVRRRLNRALARLIGRSRRLLKRPGPGAEDALERFLNRVAGLRLPRLQYAEVFALALWNWIADCLCLAAALRATGTQVPWQGLFLAYCAAMTASSVGLTPGNLGIAEAALSAALVGAGVAGRHALAAVLVYRLISFWLVMMAGWVVMALLARAGVVSGSRRRAGAELVPSVAAGPGESSRSD